MDLAVRTGAHDSTAEQGGTLDVAALYRTTMPQLKHIAAGAGLSPADAEDALQDSYVALLQRRSRFQDAQQATRWLVRVTVNRCFLHHRKRRRLSNAVAGWRRTRASGRTAEHSDTEAVRQGLRQLEGNDLAPLVLRYFCDMNANQIGEMLSMPASTVRSQLRKARIKLADILLSRGVSDDFT